MAYKIDQKRCMICGMCEERCPVNAIKLENDMFYVEEEKCIECGLCAKICFPGAINK